MKNLIIILSMLIGFTWASGPVIIVHKDNPVTSISTSDLKKMFMGKKANWDNGTKVVPMHLVLESDGGNLFVSSIGTNPSKFKAKWLKLVYSGKATPPQMFKNSTLIDNMVNLLPGGIGVVNTGYAPTNPNVKVIPLK